jgi:PTH1 family peptidyl-tRNA hydrolase
MKKVFAFIKKMIVSDAQVQKEEDNSVKYLITGLGNIGVEYNDTRHNIGFDVVDYLAAKFEASYKNNRYGFTASFRYKGRTFVLLKPTTYMNLSGQAVRYWLQKEKIKQQNLMVISDDLNIQFGQVKIKPKGSAGGHNGLKNIEQLLKTNQYPRLRVGIGNNYSKGRQVDFVLGKWAEDEWPLLDKVIQHAANAVIAFASIGIERSMNQYNKDLNKPQSTPKKKQQKPDNKA